MSNINTSDVWQLNIRWCVAHIHRFSIISSSLNAGTDPKQNTSVPTTALRCVAFTWLHLKSSLFRAHEGLRRTSAKAAAPTSPIWFMLVHVFKLYPNHGYANNYHGVSWIINSSRCIGVVLHVVERGELVSDRAIMSNIHISKLIGLQAGNSTSNASKGCNYGD